MKKFWKELKPAIYFTLAAFFISASIVQAGFISQTNIFSGEVASNLTDGAPLSVSATGKITTGITNSEVAFSSNITTTSASDVLLTGMSITPSLAGTYLVMFSTWLTQSTGNDIVTMSIYVNGVQNSGSIRSAIPFVGALSAVTQDMPLATQAIVTYTTGTIQIDWHVNAGTGTAHNGTLDIMRLQ